MLKKGFAWHYTAYDQRPELAKVSKLFPRLNFSATIYNARYLKNKCLFSLTVGETSTDWPEGTVGVVEAAETMGVAEGQAQRDGMNIERTSGCSARAQCMYCILDLWAWSI